MITDRYKAGYDLCDGEYWLRQRSSKEPTLTVLSVAVVAFSAIAASAWRLL